MTILIYGGLILGIGFILALTMANKDEKKIVAQTEGFFQNIERKYEDFVDKSLNLSVISEGKTSTELEDLVNHSFTILKPDIDGIVAYVNSINYSSIDLKHSTEIFKGASSLTQSMFRKTGSGSQTNMSSADEKKLYESFKDAIRSDLSRRLLDLRTNNYLD